MISPAVFWPSALGVGFLIAGLYTYRDEAFGGKRGPRRVLFVLAPAFIASAIAAFAGEHFTITQEVASLVPKWLPGKTFITYFVGGAHIAAALSLVARRCVRWSSISLALMFALFVLLLWLPSAIALQTSRMTWIVTVRETTFSLGALALFSTQIGDRGAVARIASVARVWCGLVLIFFGIENILFPRFWPGVPDARPIAAWVPLPAALAYVVGLVLIGCGLAMCIKNRAELGSTIAGVLMLTITILLFVPEYFLNHGVGQRITAINFIFDTLLFAGTVLSIGKANLAARTYNLASESAAVVAGAQPQLS